MGAGAALSSQVEGPLPVAGAASPWKSRSRQMDLTDRSKHDGDGEEGDAAWVAACSAEMTQSQRERVDENAWRGGLCGFRL